jgi:phosphoglycerate dehydrogenase-like enzyme
MHESYKRSIGSIKAIPTLALSRPKACMVMPSDNADLIYTPLLRARLAELLDINPDVIEPSVVERNPEILGDIELLITGWGAPALTEKLLAAAPRLRAVFYGGGACTHLINDAVTRRGIQITGADAANAMPVVEFTCAQIIMCLKKVWQAQRDLRQTGLWAPPANCATTYRSRIGLVSLGEICWRVAQRLADLDVEVLAYDIKPDQALAQEYGLRYTSLEELFASCDVISLHAPLTADTTGMVNRKLLASMKHGASLINTARGRIIDEPALIDVLRLRPDLFAVLDVLAHEPPAIDHPLLNMDNVVVTPHIAGSIGRECERLGQCMIHEIEQYLAGRFDQISSAK